MSRKIILVGDIKLPFRITIKLQNFPSTSSPDNGSSDGGRNEEPNTRTVRNPQEPQSPSTVTDTTISGTSPTLNESNNSGGSESEGSEGEPPMKRTKTSSTQTGFPEETDSGESTGEEDTLSIISISSGEGPESPDEKEHPQKC